MTNTLGRRPRKTTPQRHHPSEVEGCSDADMELDACYSKGDVDADDVLTSLGVTAHDDGDTTDEYTPDVPDALRRRRGRPRTHKIGHSRPKPIGRHCVVKRKHRCTLCDMTFVRADHLHHHILKHSSEKPFKCDHCSAAFKIASKLKEHVRVHTGERPFECGQCNQRFMRATHLKKHTMAHTGEKPFMCALCGRSFTNNASLKEHHYRHTGERPHKCTKCDVAFTRKISLQEHMRIHTGERPFKCPCCDMSFARRNGLRNHMTLHTGEKPYLCQTCGARFRHNTAFAEHVRIHTGAKPYVCQHCGTAFTCKSTLKKHVRLHTGEKPYTCSACGAGFAQRTSLACHIKKHPGLTLPAAFTSHRQTDQPQVCINPVVGRNKKARPTQQPANHQQYNHQQPQQQLRPQQQTESSVGMPTGSPVVGQKYDVPTDRRRLELPPASHASSSSGCQPPGVSTGIQGAHSMRPVAPSLGNPMPHSVHAVQQSGPLGLGEHGAGPELPGHRHPHPSATSHLGHWGQEPLPGLAGFSYDHQVASQGPHQLSHQGFPGVLPMASQVAFPDQQRFPLDYRFSMS